MDIKDKIQWRREQIQLLLAKGHSSCREIAGNPGYSCSSNPGTDLHSDHPARCPTR